MNFNNRRDFFKKIFTGLLTFAVAPKIASKANSFTIKMDTEGPFFTNGFKIAEVDTKTSMLWTRLCAQAEPNPVRHERIEKVFRHPIDFDENQEVSKMDGAVAGTEGLVRAIVKDKQGRVVFTSDWKKASAENDFTAQIPVKGLKPGHAYQIELEAKSTASRKVNYESGAFSTAPGKNDKVPVLITTSTCQYFWSFDDKKRGFHTYDSMTKLNPDFFVHTGDYIYYDKPGPLAKNIEKARHKWHAMNGWPSLRDFFKKVPIYMIKDDHDVLKDDAYLGKGPYGDLTFQDGVKLWYENVPIDDKPYRTVRWGKDLQFWMVEGREYRSANDMEDGVEKSIWGKEQIDWFTKSVAESDATFKLLFTATPIVGPDREKKKDNHSNSNFSHEGEWLRRYLSSQKNMFVVNGDRHWQYVSKDAETGLMEFGSGPVSDYHVQGWDKGDVRPEHQYLNLIGGFLSIQVDRKSGKPKISFKHRDVFGKEMHEESFIG
tara:strand:+ start:3473 stop:4936 length:1464 start_codon:yes stop_codon:yes gene_type:complete